MEREPHHQEETETRAERDEGRPTPRIYVASLSDYNAGRLHGAWLDAAQEPEVLAAAVQAVLDASPEPGAEEFAIHDYEEFGPWRIGEFEPLGTVAMIANGIAEHGLAFAHWAALVGTEDAEQLTGFDDAYLGHFGSLTEYGEDFLEGVGLRQELDEAVPELLAAYVDIDVAAFARDLMLSGDVMTSEGEGGVHVFNQSW